ncbi:MAG: glycosyltransferase [Planctomycetes bacterium]|nr:glycosyltransferase [Planctomycetota bacterium]
MKVLMITHGFPPECSGGTESYVLALCRELLARGHEVEVLTGSHEGAGADQWEPRLEHSEHEGIPVHRLHRTGLFVDNWEKSLAPEVEPLLQKVLEGQRPDLVHVQHWIRMSRNLVEICHDAGVPTVCTLHDLWTCCPKAFRIRDNTHCTLEAGPTNCLGCAPAGENMSDEEQRRELALFRDDFRNELDLARRLIVPSCAHRDVLLSQMPSLRGKFRVVPHGNISALEKSNAPHSSEFPAGPLNIGHWGHLNFFKGLDLLLEALQESKHKDDIKLQLFGDVVYPQERPRVEELSAGLDIVWHGRYTPTDLASVPMDVAVIPSRCSESWSFVLDEAFLLGIPAIVSDRGALGERVQGAGTAFAADDADDLRRVIDELFDDPQVLGRWREGIPELPGIHEHTDSVERVYEEVLTSRAPLPRTPPQLRTRRLQVRSYQLEIRNRHMESQGGDLENLQKDYARAKSDMEDMGSSHREKDKEIGRLNLELLQARGSADSPNLDNQDQALDELPEDPTPLPVGRMRALETANAALTLKQREALSALETRAAEVGALEEQYADIRRGEAQNRDQGAARARESTELRASFERQRIALTHLREALEIQQQRLRDLERRNTTLGEEVGNAGEARPGDGDAVEVPHLSNLIGPAQREEYAFTTELSGTETEVMDFFDATVRSQVSLQSTVSKRDARIREMSQTLDGLLDMVESTERKRHQAESAQRAVKHPGQRLKILMVVHQYVPRHVAGTEVYTHNLASALSKRHDVLVLAAESDYDKDRFAEQRIRVDGVAVHQVTHNYKWSSFRDTYDCPEADAIFRRILREEAPDVVHIQHLHYFSANFVTIARSRGIPVVYTLHDYMLMCPRDGTLRREDGEICQVPVPSKCRDCIAHHELDGAAPPVLPRGLLPGVAAMVPADVVRELRRARQAPAAPDAPPEEAASERLDYLRRVLADVDLFVSPSEFLRQRFIDAGMIDADRIIASDNGYDLARLPAAPTRPARASDQLRVGYVGTIAKHKGIHLIVDAMNDIDDDRVACRIWGDVTAFWEYTEQLRHSITNPKTLLMGPFENHRITDILCDLDLLIVPSLWFENSPLTVHEAAACGVPVLASDQGGLAEYVLPEVTGRHFALGDVDDLRRKILSFIENPMTAFNPGALTLKSIEDDAQDTEQRYFEILSRKESLVG